MVPNRRRSHPLARLVYKDSSGEHSSSKLWFSLANLAILVIYILLGLKLVESTTPNLEGWAILTLVISSLLTGNKLANMVIKARYGAGREKDVDKLGEPGK